MQIKGTTLKRGEFAGLKDYDRLTGLPYSSRHIVLPRF